MENNKIYLIKDNENQIDIVTTNIGIVATRLADVHNEAVLNDVEPDEEFADSLSGFHCSVWSEDGKFLAMYGEEDCKLCKDILVNPNEIAEDILDVLTFGKTYECTN